MFSRFADEPGLLYVVATLLPLASFAALLVAGGLKNLGRTYKHTGWGQSLYWLLGGDQPGGSNAKPDPRPGTRLELGYRIDHLGAVMFAMVTFIATLIHIFALGYMAKEVNETVEDHHAVVHHETPDPASGGSHAPGDPH